MRAASLSSLAGLAALLLSGCPQPLAAEPAATGPPFRVGVAPEFPPMIFKEGPKLVGVEADFAQALGRELGRPVIFVELPWEDLLNALEAERIDIIMSSMSITRARQFRVAFADPYLRIGQMALVRADEQYRYMLFENSLAEKAVGVRKATTGDLLVQQEFPRAKRKYFKTGNEAAKALVKKKIDLFVSDSTVIWYLAGLYEAQGLVVAPMVMSDEMLAWGVRRTDTQLLESVNAFVKRIKASGDLMQILRRWMPRFQ
jgi:polar amino acid transport system substrate-binding protein